MIETSQTPSRESVAAFPRPDSAEGSRAAWLVIATVPPWLYAIYYLGSQWYANADYSYGWLVPLLCMALFWERWQRRPSPGRAEAEIGPVILGAALGVMIVTAALLLQLVPGWRFAAWILGGSLVLQTLATIYLAGGKPWARHFAFPLLFFLIAIPWPGRIEFPMIDALSQLNATISAFVANLLGSPAIREGITIRVGAGLVGVDEACSGIRSFQASVMVALFLGELFRFGLLRRVVFLACGVGVAMLCNVVRTTYLVRTCDLHGIGALNVNHDAAGLVILGVTMVALLGLAWVFSRVFGANPSGPSEAPGEFGEPAGTVPEAGPGDTLRTRSALFRLLGISLSLILVAEIGAYWWFRDAGTKTVSTASWNFDNSWLTKQSQFTNHIITHNVKSKLRYSEAQHVSWTDDRGRPWQLFYFKWEDARTHYGSTLSAMHARGHAVDVCLSYLGVPLVRTEGEKFMSFGDVKFLGEIQRFDDHGRAMHTLALYTELPARRMRQLPKGEPGTWNGLRLGWNAMLQKDRARTEKRVFKCALWGVEDDAEASEIFRKLIEKLLRTA